MNSLFSYSFSLKGITTDDYGNTKESAVEIQLDTKVEGVENYYCDSDYFSFKPSADGAYYIEMSTSSSSKIHFNVIDESGRQVFVYSHDSNPQFDLKKDTKYYIFTTVDNCFSPFNYSFVLKGPNADDYGNTKEEAHEIQANTVIEGDINYSPDKDFFCFTPAVDGEYYICNFSSSENGAGQGKILEIFDADENNLSTFYYDSFLAFRLEKGKRYYLSISNDNCRSIMFCYSFMMKGPIADDYGNTKESAVEIKAGNLVKGYINFNDTDCFSFRPSTEGMYKISNYYKASGGLLSDVLSFYDKDGNTIKHYSNSEEIVFYLCKDTMYYIYVAPTDNSPPQFHYKLELTEPKEDDYYNIHQSAKEIKTRTKVEGRFNYINDIDCFSFRPSVDGKYYLEGLKCSFASNRLYITDNYEKEVPYRYIGDIAYFVLTKDTKYYFTLDSTTNYSNSAYWFKVELSLVDDYGNTKETANEIQLNNLIIGFVNSQNDCDYFSFEPSTTGIYYLDNYTVTSADENYASPYIGVIDSDDTHVGMELYEYRSKNYYFSLTEGKKYYIYVKIENSFSMFNYKFRLKGPIFDDFANTPGEAAALEIGKDLDGKIDYYIDRDMFSFTTKEEGLYFITVDRIDLVDIALYDKYFNEVSISEYNQEYLKRYYRLLPNQPYYIRLSADRKTGIKYSVCVKGPLIDDYGNSNNNGTVVKVGDTGITINYQGDVDVLKFIPSTTGTYCFKFNGNTNSAIKLYDCFGAVIKCAYVDAETVSCNLTAYDAYNIAVNEDGKLALGSYTVTISKQLVKNTFKITGYIKPDFVSSSSSPLKAGFIVALEGTQLSAVSDETGYFEIKDIPASDKGLDITITKESYLKRELNNIVVSGNVSLSLPESPIEMWPGDMGESQDGAINIKDIIQIAECFNSIKGDSRYMENMDVDCNSVINILDIILVSKHFNKSTETYPN